MEIKDKLKLFIGESLGAGGTNPAMGNRNINQEKQFIMRNKAVLQKLIQHMNWNDNRLTIKDIQKNLGNLTNQAMAFGWLQKTKHPGEWYELSQKGVDAIGGIAGVLR